MNKSFNSSLLSFAFLLSTMIGNAQKQEAYSITPLAKTSKKATESACSFNSKDKTLQLYYATPKGKKTIVDSYKFDWNLKLIAQNTEEIASEEAMAKIDKTKAHKDIEQDANYTPKKVTATYFKVVAGGGIINSKIEKGSYTAQEVWNDQLGDYVWEYTAGEGSELKLKSDDRKIQAIAATADQNETFFTPGFWDFSIIKNFPSAYFVPQNYLSVIGSVTPVNKKTKGTKNVDNQTYTIQTYMNNKGEISLANEQIYKFKGPQMVVQKVQYPDASVGILFAPHNRVSQLGFDKSILQKPTEYSYLHVAPNGKILDSIHFECPANAWKPEMCAFSDGALYLAGAGSKIDPTKYYFDLKDGDADQFIVAKIKDGKMEYLNSSPLSLFNAKNRKPASQKDDFSFTGKDIANSQLLIQDDKLLIVGQYIYRGKNLNYMVIQFDKQGIFNCLYAVKNETDFAGNCRLFTNSDNKTITWMITETKKIDENTKRKFQYVRMANINPSNFSLSEFTSFGTKTKDQKNEYFLNKTTPMIILDHNIILIGGDQDNESIWLSNIAL